MIAEHENLQALIREVIKSLNLNPDEPGFKETPRRVASYLLEYRKPFNPRDVMGEGFEVPGGFHSMVVQSGIPFRMICEHHLLPATGTVSIGYVPDKRVVGLSKLTRLAQAVGRERPALQETIGDRIADVLSEQLSPKGVAVVVKAEHSCMSARGIATPGILTTTSSVRGVFRDVPHARAEFFDLINEGKS